MNTSAQATRWLISAIAINFLCSCGGGGGSGDAPTPPPRAALITIPYNNNDTVILDANNDRFGVMDSGRSLFSLDFSVELGNYMLQENYCLNVDGNNVGFVFLRDVSSQRSVKLKTNTPGKEAVFAWHDENDGNLKYIDISLDSNGAAHYGQSSAVVPGDQEPPPNCIDRVVFDDQNPDDNYDTAPPLSDPGLVSGSVSSIGDVWDIYQFTPSKSTDYSITLVYSNPDLDLHLYDADRKVLLSSNSVSSTTERIQSDLIEGETYYVVVYAYETTGEESYTLTVDSTPPVGIIDDGDNTSENARWHPDNGSYEGSVSSETDPQDFLRFMASRSAMYTFHLQFTNPDIDLYLYDADGRSLKESNTNSATTEQFQQNLDEGGIYYLRVHAFATSGVERYILSLQYGEVHEKDTHQEEQEKRPEEQEREEEKRREEQEREEEKRREEQEREEEKRREEQERE